MSEERMFILRMIEEGKITAEEGAALLEALRDDARNVDSGSAPAADQDVEDDRPSESHADGEEGERTQSDESAEEQDQARKPRPADVASQIKEAVQSALKGVPQVTDELKDNWKEVAEDLRHSFHEIRDEIRKKGLVDVSGLMGLISHMRDVGFGQTHEFVEEIEDVLSESDPTVELSTTNGAIAVRGWEKPRYRLIMRKRLQSTDEEKAREIAAEIVDLSTEDGDLRAVVRHVRNASVSMELWLPKENAASIDVRSENGSIRFEGVKSREATVATTNGSVNVVRVGAERVSTRTTNGKIACVNIRAQRAEAKTTNGSVSWSGVAESGEIRTVNGTARLEPHSPDSSDGAASLSERTSEYDVSTVNGSVHVELPEDDETGVKVVAHGRSVRAEGENNRVSFNGNNKGEHRGETPDYDEAAKKMILKVRTVNGSIRLNAKGKSAPADEGGEPDTK